jgi:hypothetical protein
MAFSVATAHQEAGSSVNVYNNRELYISLFTTVKQETRDEQ